MSTGATPMRPHGTSRSWRTGYWFVLALVITSYTFCAVQGTTDPSVSAFLVQLVTLAVTVRVAQAPARLQRIAWTLLGVAGVAAIVVRLVGGEGHLLDVALSAASMIAFLVAPIMILAHQARRLRVDVESLLAAVASYVMVGMFFTFLYNFIGLVAASPIFSDAAGDSLSRQLFFSFTTLTTIGYGNIVPLGPAVEGVAVAEAITGQLFLIIAVARIIRGNRTPPLRVHADAAGDGEETP